MTAKDKTGAKLVDSMRKTKAAAADKADSAANAAQETAKQKSPPPAKKRAAAKRVSDGADKHGSDPYQNGRRVWPD